MQHLKNTILYCIVLSLLSAHASAQVFRFQDPLFLGGKKYLLDISGSVYHERFSHAQAVLTINYTPTDEINPLQINIDAFPHAARRNGFMWNSQDSEMVASFDKITCDIKRFNSKLNLPRISFNYISPVLFKKYRLRKLNRPETHRDKENEELAMRDARAIQVRAQAGKLTLKFNETAVSGTVWMKGYDITEQAYVQYNARFEGKLERSKEQSQENINTLRAR